MFARAYGTRLFSPAVLGAALLFCLTAAAQTTPGSPVEQLRQRLTGGSATATVHLSHLHGTTRALIRPVDNLVVDGAVRSRPVMGLLRGADEEIPAGQVVHVLSVEAVPGKQHDVLRITVSTPGNAISSVAFLLPADALQSMTEPQLEALVFPALTPVNNSPPNGRAGMRSVAEVPAAPPAPAGWVARTTPVGAEALLRGTAETGGKPIPALLVLGCPTSVDALQRPALVPTVELRVPKANVAFDVAFTGEKDGDDNGYIHFQVGSAPEIQADLATWSTLPEAGNVALLGLDLRPIELESLVEAKSLPLRIGVVPISQESSAPASKPEQAIHASFVLPENTAAVQGVMARCIAEAKSANAAEHASRMVECPQTSTDLQLATADVKRAASGKSLPTDPEHDQGSGWNLPKPTKAHPAPVKTVLVCSYTDPKTPTSSPPKVLKTLSLPIPPAAHYCESFSRMARDRSEAFCKK